jgi:signal transduction histidine kinase
MNKHRKLKPAKLIDLNVFLRALVALLDLPAGVEIDWTSNWPTIETDPTLLRQIFQNLILNAVTFNQSVPKWVELSWRLFEPDRYEFSVRDNGIGIESRYQAQIFQMF